MPLYEFSAAETSHNLRRNRSSVWPDGRRKSEKRLAGFVGVTLHPTFQFDTSDKILTIGSCFAREIEAVLSDLGFTLPALDVEVPAEERTTAVGNDILNKYTVHSMENEIRWGFEPLGIPPEDFYLRAGEDTWHDAQMVGNLKPASLERVQERRAMVSDMMHRLPECRVVVITLGLVEAWFDTKTQMYLNGMPPAFAIKAEPDRFLLRVLEYDEIVASLHRIHALLVKYGHPDFKMLLTVSPVPFKATLTGRDALVANTYGKSVQRAAAEVFASAYDDVNYFPSYELVTLTNRDLAYTEDNIHVTRDMVAHIMATVLHAYAGGEAPQASAAVLPQTKNSSLDHNNLSLEARENMKSGDYDSAVTNLSSLIYRFEHKVKPDMLINSYLTLGVALLRTKQTFEGVVALEKCHALAPDDARIAYKLGLGYGRLKRDAEALEMFQKVLGLDQSDPDYHWRLGAQLMRMGRQSEVRPYLEAALKLKPDHVNALADLEKIMA